MPQIAPLKAQGGPASAGCAGGCGGAAIYTRPADPAPLRLAVAVAGDSLPQWLASAIGHALELPFVQLHALIRVAPQAAAAGQGVDREVAADTLGEALTWLDADRLAADAVDLILLATDGPPPASLAGKARLGLWRIRLDHPLSGLRDLMRSSLLTRVVVQSLGPAGEPLAEIYRSVGRTSLSIRQAETRRQHLLSAAMALKRAIMRLAGLGSEAGDAAEELGGRQTLQPGSDGMPLLARRVATSLAGNVKALARSNDWQLAWRRTSADTVPGLDETDDDPPFAPVALASLDTAADPFLIALDGQLHLFFEGIRPGSTKGILAHAMLEPDGWVRDCQTILERPYHLSYPFVFAWDGGYWMIPESSAAGRVDLYRSTGFPHHWTLERTLLEGFPMVDATLHEQDGCFYLFVTIDESGCDVEHALFLFTAASPLGPFRPHPANPVRTDIRNTRCGGRLLRHKGRLYRPAQDSSEGYGSALTFQEVIELTPETYRERRAATFRPSGLRGLNGCHSFTRAGDIQMIDIRQRCWTARRQRH